MDQLDQQHERLQDDLRGLIAGDVHCDDIFLQLYSCDSSIFEIKPLGVVRPSSAADVIACVRYAADKQIPLHARGAGSGVAGESLGPGIIVDFSKYLRRIIETGEETVRVQPGIVRERLNSHLRDRGRIFGPDPATGSVTTVGSTISIDGAGSHWLRYGSARDHVRSLQVVLADGHLIEAGREPLFDGGSNDKDPRKRELIDRLARLLGNNADLIRREQPADRPNRCGYNLVDALGDGYIDLSKLFVGSEGTLGLITEATLSTEPLPRHRGVALLLFDSLDKACRAALKIEAHKPSVCDLLDRRHLSLAREIEVRFDLLVPGETEAVLLVEQDGQQKSDVRERLHQLVDEVRHRDRLAFGARLAFDQAEMNLFWQLALKVKPALYQMKGAARPVPVVDDLVVPPEMLGEFLVQLQNVLKRYQVTAAVSAHPAQGLLHVQPLLDLSNPEDVGEMLRLVDELYDEVFRVGGTIGGEHGFGLTRTPFIHRQSVPLYKLFRQVKQILDPDNILNPGKIVSDSSTLPTTDLRPFIAAAPGSSRPETEEDESPGLRDLTELQLNWEPEKLVEAARRCNGCGRCRTQGGDTRTCPIFRLLPAEEYSPRAKANLIRGVLTGRLELSSLTSDQFKTVADLCVNCYMCLLECPAEADVPRLMAEGKAAYVAANGLKPSDWVMTHLDSVLSLAALGRPLLNWALGNRQMRWLMEKTLGIAQGRKLPRLASPTFIRRAARRKLTKPARHGGRKVVYFVDTFANYHDPQLAEALVDIMEHNGISVFVPPEQRPSGMSAVSCGALDSARQLARLNVAALVEAVRQGYHVVATEPAAALCLIREYPNLLDDDDARQVAENTSEACTYLWRMHTLGKLQLDLKPINFTVGYHTPCRLMALKVGSPGENLLGLIPGLTVEHIEEGCSGMAGTFGLASRNYRTSLRAGWGLISRLRDPAIQAGVTECSACKIQMEQGTTKPTVHPLKLLAGAYGLLPESAALLTNPGEELIVT